MRQSLSLVALIAWAAVPAAAQVTLRGEIAADKPFAVENLAGRMKVVSGPGNVVQVVATVHAESEGLARELRFEQVVVKGIPTLRLQYPLDRHDRISCPGLESHGHSQVEYAGHRVRVSDSGGTALCADLEVQVPRRAIEATFRNAVGPIAGQGIEGRIRLDSASGAITARDLKGDVSADTGSGDVSATGIAGSLRCDTGSGNCEVSGFKGDDLRADTGSGEVRITDSEARRVLADTGSGDVRLEGVSAGEVKVDTGSGRILLVAKGGSLTRVVAESGSGSVRLRLGADASFEARASTASGDLLSRYQDAEPILHGKEVVGWRRGDGRIRIRVETASGDVILEPAE